jgi:hypothetical protein
MEQLQPMKEPNFFIVGVPKCGTTALSQYLKEHPQIFLTSPKEPAYFARHVFVRNGPEGAPEHRVLFDAYLELYAAAGPEHIAVGEATPIYLQSDRAMKDLRDRFPHAKIIVMARNPVEIARSLHGQKLKENEEIEPDFAKAWQLQSLRAEGRGLDHHPQQPEMLQYGWLASIGTQLETVLKLFRRDQVKVLMQEDLEADPAAVYEDTLEFLGVPSDGRRSFPVVNESRAYGSFYVRIALESTPRSIMAPYIVMKRALGLESRSLGLRRWARERFSRRPTIKKSFRSELITHFEPEMRKFERLLDREFPEWRK